MINSKMYFCLMYVSPMCLNTPVIEYSSSRISLLSIRLSIHIYLVYL